MKFEVGDKVVVKHSNEDGKVVEILAKNMVLVDVRGVRFPAYTDQLDFPYFKQFSSRKLVEEKKPAKQYIDEVRREKQSPRYQVAEGVWLLFFPIYNKDVFDDDIVEELKVYLVNQTNHGLRFHFWLRYNNEAEIEIQNESLALNDFYLVNLPFEKLNDAPSFHFEFSLLTPQKDKTEYYEAQYKPKPKQVFKLIQQIQQTGSPFFSHQLFKAYPDKTPINIAPETPGSVHPFEALSKKGFKVSAARFKQQDNPPPSVLDLHIEKLTDDHRNMSAHEKLTLQLQSLDRWLDKAELHYLKNLWVIHGIGTGRLKEEVHEVLKRRENVKSFIAQYHPWYGYGATEILLK